MEGYGNDDNPVSKCSCNGWAAQTETSRWTASTTLIPNQRPKISIVGKSKLGFSYNANYGGIPPTFVFFCSILNYQVKCRQYHGSLKLDNSNQTLQQTAENILNARSHMIAKEQEENFF